MLAPAMHFDYETVALMGRVCDEAWEELQRSFSFRPPATPKRCVTVSPHASSTRQRGGNVILERLSPLRSKSSKPSR